MKRIEILVLFLIFYVSISCQKKSETSIPYLIGNKKQMNRLIVKDVNLADSLKVVFQVVVKLEYPLRDTSKHINVKKVDILRLSALSLSTKEQIIDFSYINENGSDYQKHIWDICLKKFSYWYNNQPYEKLVDRNQWGDKVVLGGTLYLLPDN
jgi:hypothetical protein